MDRKNWIAGARAISQFDEDLGFRTAEKLSREKNHICYLPAGKQASGSIFKTLVTAFHYTD